MLTPGAQMRYETTTIAKKKQAVNVLNLNLTNPNITIEMGYNSPLNTWKTVPAFAKANTYDKHHVIGAVNASLFHTRDNKLPMYLLAQNKQILNFGAEREMEDTGFMSVPAAFGMDESGKAIIDRYKIQASFSYQGNTYLLSGFNRAREENESVLFTSSFRYPNTRTNSTGYEVIVAKLSKDIDKSVGFGETVTGQIVGTRPYGEKSSAMIPKDGFVISTQGMSVEQVRNMKIGDEISLTIDIDEKWQNSKFMLASGPLLVQEGKTNLTIDTSTAKAKARRARTAITVDAAGTRVYMVTVDNTKGNPGMTLEEFADYLVSLGAYQAINLDGGGSTTMAIRNPGSRYAGLINSPSDGRMRPVSTVLQAISKAPYGPPAKVSAKRTKAGTLKPGDSTSFTVTSVLDSYNNLLPIYKTGVKVVPDPSINKIGKMSGNKFIATKPGTGFVTVNYASVSVKVPVKVAKKK
ncbi:phosphodiester glycosidase family protein [Peribacillus sp. NPDC096379]|uniref:phosphodiester glycosidase family protein n=1 Tax=Peribacillus sp. NPDC096379 TaxID=3364393 RepID=UPI003822EEE9